MSNHDPSKTLIFDLTGVLFTFNQWQVFKLIGIKDTILYVLSHGKNPFTASLELAQVIARNEVNATVPPTHYKKYLMPSCITQGLLGTISAREANTRFKNEIQGLIDKGLITNHLEIKIMRLLADVMSDVNIRMKIMPVNKELVAYINELKQNKNYQLFMLSNLDMETYRALNTLYPEVFDLFDQVIISADIGMIKPHLDIYHYMLTTFHLDPARCIFIDDQQENLDGAKKLGIKGILYTSYRSLKRTLGTLLK